MGVIIVLAVAVVVAVLVMAFVLGGTPALQTGGSCTIAGSTNPGGVTISVRKAVMDASGNAVRTVIGSTMSSSISGAYTLTVRCGNGFYDVVATRDGYDSTMLQSLDWNYPPVTTTWNPTLSPTTPT